MDNIFLHLIVVFYLLTYKNINKVFPLSVETVCVKVPLQNLK